MKDNLLTQSQLIQRGWTQSLIKQFLPEPILKQNPCYASAAPMKLWTIEDIEKAEQGKDFTTAMEKARCRKEAAKKATATRKQKLMQEIEVIIAHTTIKKLDDESVVRRALDSKRSWYMTLAQRDYERYEFYGDVKDADQETVDRWTVNYIRHKLTHYDKTLGKLKGRVGVVSAYPEFRNAILSKIAEVYPQYKNECERQQFALK